MSDRTDIAPFTEIYMAWQKLRHENDILQKQLKVGMKAMKKAERLLDNNFGFRSQEDIDAWNILNNAFAEIAKIEKEGK